jgi:hypothetical protein
MHLAFLLSVIDGAAERVRLRHMPAIMGTPNITSAYDVQRARSISELSICLSYFGHKFLHHTVLMQYR